MAEQIYIGDLCELKYGDSLPERNRITGNIPVYGSNGVVGYHNEKLSSGETLVIGRKGSVGKVHYSQTSCFPIDTTYYVDKTKKACNFKWLYYYLQTLNLPELNKSSAVPGLNRNDVYEIKIRFPSIKSQEEIAQLLEEADIVRQKRKAANALTDQFLQSTFISMFGNPIENSKGWHKEQIQTLVHSIISGKSVQSEQRKKVNGEFGVLKVSAVTYGFFKPEEHKAITNGFIPDESIKPKKGDVLFSRANTKELVAATCIVDKNYHDLFLPDKLWKINLDPKKVNPAFFKYVLSHPSYRNKLSEKATGTSGSMFNISKEKLCEFDFPIPPLSLQQKFASIVAYTEQLRQKQKQSEIELENLFHALLQKYFG